MTTPRRVMGETFVGEGYAPLSKIELFRRLSSWVPGPELIGKSAFLEFCGATWYTAPELIPNEAQERLSRGFYWFDRGRLKVRKKAGKQELYLLGKGLTMFNPKPDNVRPTMTLGPKGVDITWR